MRGEPAVLVNDDDGGPLALRLAAHEVAIDLALGGIIRDPFCGESGVVRGHDRGARIVVLQQR